MIETVSPASALRGRLHVLVFEPTSSGHHLVFLRYIVEDLLSAGHRVTLAAESGPSPSAALRDALGDTLARCQWLPLTQGPGRWLRGRKLDALVRAQADANADLVFACCLDLFSSDLCRRRAIGVRAPQTLHGRISGIFVRPRVADGRLPDSTGARWKRRGFERLLRDGWFHSIFTFDETLPGAVAAGVHPAQFHVLPDPWAGDFTAGRADARRRLGLPADEFLFLHYGTAGPRKGLPTVVRAAKLLPSGCALVCAGRAGTDQTEELGALAAAGRAHVFNRFITDVEEPLFFRACDAVVLAYEGHYGSSNVQARAAAAGRPVVASAEGLVGERTRAHGLGPTFATGDAGSLAAALLEVRGESPETYADALERYAGRHHRVAFRSALVGGLALPLKTYSTAELNVSDTERDILN